MSDTTTVDDVLRVGLELNRTILGLSVDDNKVLSQHGVLRNLLKLFAMTGTPLTTVVARKLEHNRKKYSVGSMQDRLHVDKGGSSAAIEKYTSFSEDTGVTKTSNDSEIFLSREELLIPTRYTRPDGSELDELREKAEEFARERGWNESTYCLPRIVCVLVSELGEFFDAIQWQDLSSKVTDLPLPVRNRMGAELADILICYFQYSWSHSRAQLLSDSLAVL